MQPENYLKAAEQSTEQNYNMIDGMMNNTPTVSELEAKAKAGEYTFFCTKKRCESKRVRNVYLIK